MSSSPKELLFQHQSWGDSSSEDLLERQRRFQILVQVRLLESLVLAFDKSRDSQSAIDLLQQPSIDLVAPKLPYLLITNLRHNVVGLLPPNLIILDAPPSKDTTDPCFWEKMSHLLRYIVWGNNVNDMKLQKKQWTQKWRKNAGDLILYEHHLIVAEHALFSFYTLLPPIVAEKAWRPAAILAGLSEKEIAQLLAVLESINVTTSNNRISTSLIQFAFDHTFFAVSHNSSCTYTDNSNNNNSSNGSNIGLSHELLNSDYFPRIRVPSSLMHFLERHASGFEVDHLIAYLYFYRETQNTKDGVHGMHDVALFSNAPMRFFYETLASLDHPTLNVTFIPGQQVISTNHSIRNAAHAALREQDSLIKLLDLILGLERYLLKKNVQDKQQHQTTNVGRFTPLLTTYYREKNKVEWVMPLSQWNYWSRHTTLFFAMCQRFGAPLKHHSVYSFREEWPLVALEMLGLLPTSKTLNSKNPLVGKSVVKPPSNGFSEEELANGSMWYAMAVSWVGHRGYLGICQSKLKLPSKRLNAESCSCIYCNIFRSGWHCAYSHIHTIVQDITNAPVELVYIIWNYLLYDPRIDMVHTTTKKI